MLMPKTPKKIPTRVDQMLTLAGLGVLLVGCFLVLQPFLTAVIWAAILCATSWPLVPVPSTSALRPFHFSACFKSPE